MQSDLSWDDLILFTHVARTGTLTAAADRTSSSPATLSRRMKALEARMGRRLFLHGAQGYALTGDGRALLDRATRMEAAATEITQWQAQAGGLARVRISAGSWTTRHIAQNLDKIWTSAATWVPEFVQSNLNMDIARREIDIGIRNARPTQNWLAGQRTDARDYAVYAKNADVTGWIAASGDAANAPTAKWLRAQPGVDIVSTANDPRLLYAMACAGMGRVVLPCFVGEGEPGLMRIGDPIDELRTEEWLVCHQDARFDPPIRAALDALSAFLRQPLRRLLSEPKA